VTPEALAAALARAGPPGCGIPVVRYAGPVPPAGLRWMVHRPGRDPEALVGPVVVSAAIAAAHRASRAVDRAGWEPNPADDLTATLHGVQAELGRELRRAATIGIGRTPHADIALTAADLDVVAALLEAPAAHARGGRAAHRHTAVLATALDAWLATVRITPRTVDDPVDPHHETRCALAAAARRLLAEMLAATGVPAPERR
jgi:hypothetical protein